MKLKILIPTFLLWVIMSCCNMCYGQEMKTVVFTPSEVKGSVASGSMNGELRPDEMTSGEITISSTDAAFATTKNEYRFFAGSTTTFSTINGIITKIVFYISSEEYGVLSSNDVSVSKNTSKETYTCTCSTGLASVVMKTNKVYAKKIEVTYTSLPSITLSNTDNADLLATNNGKTVNATIDRSFVADGGWYTLCLPFDVTDLSPLKNAEIRKFKSVEGTTLNFESATELKAGHAYLVKPTESIENPVFKSVVVNNTVNSDGENGYFFVGTFVNKTLKTDGTELFLGSKNQFYAPSETQNTMYGLRGYFVVPKGTNASKINVGHVSETTNVRGITTVVGENDNVFNLSGQKVGKVHNALRRGVYVVNGKKFIIK